MQSAFDAFRNFLPLLPRAGVVALRDAIKSGSDEVIAGSNFRYRDTKNDDWTITGACAFCFPFWKTMPGVRSFDIFACVRDVWGKQPGGSQAGQFLEWWEDTTPNDRRKLLPTIEEYLGSN